MERLIVLPPIKSGVRTALLNLADFKDIPTDQLRQAARQLPGSCRLHLPDRVTTIAFLLGTRLVDLRVPWPIRSSSGSDVKWRQLTVSVMVPADLVVFCPELTCTVME
jgi:hypothetical protein